MARADSFGGEFEVVLAAARRGEPWAFERIYVALSPAVAGLFRAQGVAEAEDLTSEVFLGVLRNLGRFGGTESSFRSWVFTIAYRRLADERRQRGRRPRIVPLFADSDVPAADDVHADVERSLAADRVRVLCEQLAPAQRDVLLLRLFGHLTVDEVARAVGRSRGAVKALQRRGYTTIARLVAQEGVPL